MLFRSKADIALPCATQNEINGEQAQALIDNAFHDAQTANGWEAEKKNMGLFVKAIKAALPNADGKMVAQVVQSQLG